MVLPPRAIKDEEQVGKFNMIFAVAECQNGALELAIADPDSTEWDNSSAQRLLLKKGDSFYIPPGKLLHWLGVNVFNYDNVRQYLSLGESFVYYLRDTVLHYHQAD